MSNYRDRFVDVIRFIEDNLDEEISIESLCRVTNLSKFHFHRQCSAFLGITVMTLVRLLRLKSAAYQLAYRETSIIDIALSCGYQTHESFSRAFRSYFNQSPSEFRQHPDWTSWQSKYEPVVNLRGRVMSENFTVDIVDFPELNIAVMEHRGSPVLLGDTIRKFIEWRKLNRLPPEKNRTFNLVYDDPRITPPDEFRFDVACEIKEPLKNKGNVLVTKSIPAGQCARIRHIGSDDTIGAVVNFLYSDWIENSAYELRDFPVFFERVSFFPEVLEKDAVTDVFLPIQ
ncbi:AraC family transcriptional regulator [Pleionea sediminis]|uniref:AraC family transcriptional regulator n=1 Tax=Pleionea sediminis TaxID=2569479 RepID=UPI0011870979|nr:AraC family transcriptional regulator [Pleionea sediminis]